ncbi:MAG TPA: LPS export ABC transporter periplasmic protein LptC [bacterium]|nr:LPS export ABC transporter periplasmic protein LptC [bacterium]
MIYARARIIGMAIWAIAGCASLACSLDYGTGLSNELGEGVPDMVVTGFSHTIVENGSPRFRIEADRGESYQALAMMKLESVRFTEYAADGSGAVAAEGHADSAVFHTDTESAELSGSVSFRSAHEGVTVTSGYLAWNGQTRVLESRAETVTELEKDDGSGLSGSGFSADAARRTFAFRNRATGQYVVPEAAP